MWGGIECSVTRVQGEFRDQVVETGHQDRIADLEMIAALGFSRIRYPLLWEKIAPRSLATPDWSWTDQRLAELQRLKLTPIAGLLHHGSGPAYTNLADPDFPRLFAGFAGQVAERYPWITDWTPINEPLTTARFSALYGLWYPHGRDERLFWHIFLNQIEATGLAMQAIRGACPAARLIQTEDLGFILSTPEMQGEADFQNARRWLTWDLLCGKVDTGHPLWSRIESFGFGARLQAIAENPCPPDVIGVNHYLTSNRFLDGRGEFRDVEAVRAHNSPPPVAELLMQAWRRYGLTLAVTEAHNGCTRDEQMRWTYQVWKAASSLKARGVPIEAVTVWALLGCKDWASLLTRKDGIYEVGAFDARGAAPRPTATARMISCLSRRKDIPSPLDQLVSAPGWWDRDIRFTCPPYGAPPPLRSPAPAGQPILILGRGRLGSALRQACEMRRLAAKILDRSMCDLTDPDSIAAVLDKVRPWAAINTAAFTSLDGAERDPDTCFSVNTAGSVSVAQLCGSHGVPCVSCSPHMVFSGNKGSAYRENDAVEPINIYGESKARAEQLIGDMNSHQLIVRCGTFFSGAGPNHLGFQIAQLLEGDRQLDIPGDTIFTPTYLPDAANAILDLLIDGETGIWHLTNGEEASWASLARNMAAALNADPKRVNAVKGASAVNRPRYAPLLSDRAAVLPSVGSAMERFAEEYRAVPAWARHSANISNAAMVSY
jgi:dTDP-4-dehydrorhamnose reductase